MAVGPLAVRAATPQDSSEPAFLCSVGAGLTDVLILYWAACDGAGVVWHLAWMWMVCLHFCNRLTHFRVLMKPVARALAYDGTHTLLHGLMHMIACTVGCVYRGVP